MANNPLAASKLPPLAPGEFRFVTRGLSIESEDGKRRFKTIASSTIKDMGKDEMKLSALEDLAAAFRRGLTIFMNHKYAVPEDVFGRSDTAEIVNSNERDDKGNPIWDLHIAGVVNEPNPRAVQLADSLEGGYVTFGASVGAIVREHQRNKDGGMDIYHVDGKEGSIVGIPMNQRSWTYKAARAAEALDEAEEDDNSAVLPDDDEPAAPAASAPPPETPDESEAQKVSDESVEAQKSACPDCGKGHEAEGCENAYHTKSAEGLVDDDPAVNAGVQEAEAATPENTPVAEAEETDPPTTEKAAAEVTDEVKELLGHVAKMAAEIGRLREENSGLIEKIASYEAQSKTATAEIELARQVIEKVMETPLRAKTAGYVKDFTTVHSLFDPEVSEYLNTRSKLNER